MGVNQENGIYVLTVQGTPYEKGHQHGTQLKQVIEDGISKWTTLIETLEGGKKIDQIIGEFLAQFNFLPSIETHLPHLLEEVRGIADGSGIPFDIIYTYHLFDDLTGYFTEKYNISDEAAAHCTTLGVFNRAGSKKNIVAGNCDIIPSYDKTQTMLRVKETDSDLEQLVFTFAGIIGQGGLNNRGVGMMMNTLADAGSSTKGIPSAFVSRGIIEQESTDKAIGFLKSIPHSFGMNYLLGDAGKVASVECSKNEIAILQNKSSNYVVHTNHCLHGKNTNGMDAFGSNSDAAESFAKTAERLDTTRKMLKDQDEAGNDVDVDYVKSILSTEPMNIDLTDLTFTAACIVTELDAENSVMHYAPGPPKKTDFSVFSFK